MIPRIQRIYYEYRLLRVLKRCILQGGFQFTSLDMWDYVVFNSKMRSLTSNMEEFETHRQGLLKRLYSWASEKSFPNKEVSLDRLHHVITG